ncbi:uncharacterized protein LDX57_002089 [Aspergillus melleus]|uniref:uncharacterized protein n=1 Tax=Aspergillus melleus TaxID=138277 RepID=UPI001E8CF563|nr:uncharacterized protein LDX57_002089 [Aspergillus melleus]KAH8424338.1 hypothetical protein LDX57_002089 [Aspergillus melleus]
MSQENIPANDITELCDPYGDVVLAVGEGTGEKVRKFLVFSRVLSLASPVFAKLFSHNFSEGIEIMKGTCPEVPLPEDDPEVMGTIFHMLHYQEPKEVAPKEPEFIAKFIVHANKYDCVGALRAWITNWLCDHRLEVSPSRIAIDYGHLLLSAYLFGDAHIFLTISARAQNLMAPGNFNEWEQSSMLQPGLFPQQIGFRLEEKIEATLDKIFDMLHDVEGRLTRQIGGYTMESKWCVLCESIQNSANQKCTCRQERFVRRYCTSGHRVLTYMAVLKKADLRPSKPSQLRAYSATELSGKIDSMASSLTHNCQAGSNCPLKLEMAKCSLACKNILLGDKGMLLSDFR